MLYGTVLTLAGISFVMMLRHCVRAKLFRKDISNEILLYSIKRGSLGPLIYFLSIIAAPLSVFISLGIFILVPLLYFIPQKIVVEKKMNKIL